MCSPEADNTHSHHCQGNGSVALSSRKQTLCWGCAKRDWFCPQILSEGHDSDFLETEKGNMHQLSYLETPSMWGIVTKQPLPRGLCVDW